MAKLVLLLKAPPPPAPGVLLELVTTSPLPQAIVGVFYSVSFQARGGEPPYRWSKPSGSFPAGLDLTGTSAATAVLSGTPTVAGAGIFPIRLVDSDTPTPGQIDRTYDLMVAAAPTQLTVLSVTMPPGKVGQFQSTQMQAVGGSGQIAWTLVSGSTLPPGMEFLADGTYRGTPTTVGTYPFQFRATDSLAATALSGQFTQTVTEDTLSILTSVLPFAPLNTPYDAQLLSANAAAPEVWRFIAGAPPWLTLNTGNGDLGGTSPSTPADYSITVGLSDASAAPEVTKVIGLRVLTEGPNDFYDQRVAAGYISAHRHMRSQADLDAMVKVPPSIYFTSTYPTDPDPQKQDGAKLHKPPRRLMLTDPWTPMGLYNQSKGLSATVGGEGVHTDKQPYMPVGKSTGRLLFTYDIWFGGEYYDNNGTDGFDDLRMNALKAVFVTLANVATPTGEPKNHSVIHFRLRAQQINGALGEIGRMHDDSDDPGGVPLWAGLEAVTAGSPRDPYRPTVNDKYPSGSYRILRDRWTRFWHLIELGVPVDQFTEWNAFTGTTLAPIATTTTQGGLPIGTNIPYDRVTRWMADQGRDPERVFGPAPFPHHPAYPNIGRYIFRWDSSTENWFIFPEKQILDFNNIAPGNTYTLTMPAFNTGLQDPKSFTAETTTTVSYGADMSTDLTSALNALASLYSVTIAKGSGQQYTVTMKGIGTRSSPDINMPLLVVNPSGFTPNPVVVLQHGGRQAVEYKGLREPIKSYHRNLTFEYNVPLADLVLANTNIFRRPV